MNGLLQALRETVPPTVDSVPEGYALALLAWDRWGDAIDQRADHPDGREWPARVALDIVAAALGTLIHVYNHPAPFRDLEETWLPQTAVPRDIASAYDARREVRRALNRWWADIRREDHPRRDAVERFTAESFVAIAQIYANLALSSVQPSDAP